MGWEGRTCALCLRECLCVAMMLTQATSLYQGGKGDDRRLRAKDGRKEEEEHCATNKTYSSALRRKREREKDGKQNSSQTFSNANSDGVGRLFALSNNLTIIFLINRFILPINCHRIVNSANGDIFMYCAARSTDHDPKIFRFVNGIFLI